MEEQIRSAARIQTVRFLNPIRLRDAGGEGVSAIAISDNGRLAAIGYQSGTVELIEIEEDPKSPEERRVDRLLRSTSASITTLQFDSAGSFLAASSRDGLIRIWSIDEIEKGPVSLIGHKGAVNDIWFSLDGKAVVSASKDRSVRVWDSEGLHPPTLLEGHEASVLQVRFGQEKAEIISASEDGMVRVWNLDRGRDPLVLRGHTGPVTHLLVDRANSVVYSGSRDGTIRAWSLVNEGVSQMVAEHGDRIRSVSMDRSDGSRIVSTSEDGTILVTELDTDVKSTVFRHRLFQSYAGTHLANPRLTTILSGGSDEAAPDGISFIAAVTFCDDKRKIVGGSEDGEVVVWDLATNTRTVLRGHTGKITGLVCRPHGRLLSYGQDGTIHKWDLLQGNSALLSGHVDRILTADFYNDDRQVVSASADGTIRIWHLDMELEERVLRRVAGDVVSAAFDSSRDRMFLGLANGEIEIWDLVSGRRLSSTTASMRSPIAIRSLDVSRDGRHLISVYENGTVNAWKVGLSLMRLRSFNGCKAALVARFSRDARKIAFVGKNNSVYVASLHLFEEPVAPLKVVEHREPVTDIRWTPDGQRVLSSSMDRTIRLSNANNGQGEPVVFTGHAGGVERIAVSDDGHWLGSVAIEDAVRVWKISWDSIVETLDESTRFCLTKSERQRFLAENESEASRGHQSCLQLLPASGRNLQPGDSR